jgi:hypothetical protein
MASSSGQGTAIIPASEVLDLIRKASGLPSTFFVSIAKAKINADGSLQANYTFDSSQAPPPPALADDPAAKETSDGNI